MVAKEESARRVLVCQHSSCRKKGAVGVLAAFQADPVAGVEVVGSNCLGQCGNGPMVLIVPEEVWYSRVCPNEVPAVVKRHLLGGRPVAAMLYCRFHPHSSL